MLSFQLTTSRGGRQAWVRTRSRDWNFNSRPHEEVDQSVQGHRRMHKHFNSRPHEEVDYRSLCGISQHTQFQLTTSRGGRHLKISSYTSYIYFNSRPHEEVDAARPVHEPYIFISTHDLTRRSTDFGSFSYMPYIFQLTTSRGGRQIAPKAFPTVSAFQLTTSRGGRPCISYVISFLAAISTHDLTRRSTEPYQNDEQEELFQLTTSRGGRH